MFGLYKGKVITFEGILGCGKTTQLEKTEKYLLEKGLKVRKFEEASERVRDWFRQIPERNDFIDSHIFTADSLIINEQIKKTSEDTIVLCERSFLSSFIYQNDLGVGKIADWHRLEMFPDLIDIVWTSEYFRFPNTVIILDVDVDEALRRVKNDKLHKVEKFDTVDNLNIARERYKRLFKEKDKFLFDIYFVKQLSPQDTWIVVRDIINNTLEKPFNEEKIAGYLKRLKKYTQ
jgi:dTMP kinase